MRTVRSCNKITVYPMNLSRRSFLALTGLLPAAALAAQGSDNGNATFKIRGRHLDRRLTLITYGDMRFTDPSEQSATDPKVRQWLVDRIAKEKPNALLVSGDVPFRGGVWSDYQVYLAETASWRKAKINVFPAIGNHELRNGSEQLCLENWWRAFPDLQGRRWYSAQLGPKVYVLNLDSNSSLLPGSEQSAWIRSELAHLPATVRFVFFNLHHPPVADFQANADASHNPRPNEIALADLLKESQSASPARFVVNAGHVHNYERFLQDGTVYLVSGGGGALPVPIERSPQDLYQNAAFPNYHYVKFVLHGAQLRAAMYRVADPSAAGPSWEVTDRFVIDEK